MTTSLAPTLSIVVVTCLLPGPTFAAAGRDRDRVILARLAPQLTGLFLADANGQHERPLIPAQAHDHNASFSVRSTKETAIPVRLRNLPFAKNARAEDK